MRRQGGYFNRMRQDGYGTKGIAGPIQPFFPTGGSCWRREALDEVGLYDESLATVEDVDYCLRTARTSWEMYYEGDAIVEHKSRPTMGKMLEQWFDYGYYGAQVSKKHNGRRLYVMMPNHDE